MEDVEILTIKDVMDILGISQGTAYKIFRSRDFPRVPGVSRMLVEKQAFMHWLRNEEYQIKKDSVK